nr:glycosyltransferase family 4 protein [Actinomycetota bacterium]
FIETIKRFLKVEDSFDRNKIRENALRFDIDIFKEKIVDFINHKFSDHKNKAI